MNAAEAFDLLRSLQLPPAEFAVFGSGPLLARGIIETVGDLDVIARGTAWARAAAIGKLVYLDEHAVTVASFHGGKVTIGTEWALGEFSVPDLIDTADVIDNLPFVRLEHVITYKRLSSRSKDLAHLARIEEWLALRQRDLPDH